MKIEVVPGECGDASINDMEAVLKNTARQLNRFIEKPFDDCIEVRHDEIPITYYRRLLHNSSGEAKFGNALSLSY